jgi:flagellum-specific peptidoglycan hydrolase FlgJ
MLHLIKIHWFKIAIVSLLGYGVIKKSPTSIFEHDSKDKKPTEQDNSKYIEQSTANNSENALSLFDFFSSNTDLDLAKMYENNSPKDKAEFIKRFGKVARDEQAKYGIPASIILASSMVQSSLGNRTICKEGNNYFGLRCAAHVKNVNEGNFTYYAYASAWESFRAHSVFMTENINLKSNDYKKWSAAIEKKFNTGSDYSLLLEKIINEFKLYKLDE